MSIATDLQTIASNVPLVYNAGLVAGKAQGGGGEEASALISQLTAAIQNRAVAVPGTSYNYAFYASTFSENTFSKIIQVWDSSKTIQRADFMFADSPNIGESLYTDKLNFSNARTARDLFARSGVTKLKSIDLRKAESNFNGMANVFLNSQIVSIDEFFPSVMTIFNGTFLGCYHLTKVIFKSEIAVTGLNLNGSTKLDKQSIESIINNLSLTTTGLSVTLSKAAVNKAFETSVGANDGSESAEWLNLIADKTDPTQQYYWTIALV